MPEINLCKDFDKLHVDTVSDLFEVLVNRPLLISKWNVGPGKWTNAEIGQMNMGSVYSIMIKPLWST